MSSTVTTCPNCQKETRIKRLMAQIMAMGTQPKPAVK